jgi:hypothetical protein
LPVDDLIALEERETRRARIDAHLETWAIEDLGDLAHQRVLEGLNEEMRERRSALDELSQQGRDEERLQEIWRLVTERRQWPPDEHDRAPPPSPSPLDRWEKMAAVLAGVRQVDERLSQLKKEVDRLKKPTASGVVWRLVGLPPPEGVRPVIDKRTGRVRLGPSIATGGILPGAHVEAIRTALHAHILRVAFPPGTPPELVTVEATISAARTWLRYRYTGARLGERRRGTDVEGHVLLALRRLGARDEDIEALRQRHPELAALIRSRSRGARRVRMTRL